MGPLAFAELQKSYIPEHILCMALNMEIHVYIHQVVLVTGSVLSAGSEKKSQKKISDFLEFIV